MSISKEEFDSDRIDIAVPIREILESRLNLALRSDYVTELLAQEKGRVASYEEVVLALERLVDLGLVEAKEIDGNRWYTIGRNRNRRRLGFRQEGRDEASH